MHRLFISDLHLSPEYPVLVNGFLQLVQQAMTRPLNALYILGDWFESWIGDDDDDGWLEQITAPLAHLQAMGCQIFIQQGNRDFLMGERFLARFNGQLLPDIFILDADTSCPIRLEHGDLLCTDDIKYQQFRQLSRSADWQQAILSQPLEKRRQMAKMLRLQSQAAQSNQPDNIMDVTETAVDAALTGVQILLHGHTHRPAVHDFSNNKQRIVLGDWRDLDDTHGEAMIARQVDGVLQPENFRWSMAQ